MIKLKKIAQRHKKLTQKNNIPNPYPIPDSTGTILTGFVPPTYSGYLGALKGTGRSDGTLLTVTMQGVTKRRNQGEQPEGIADCSRGRFLEFTKNQRKEFTLFIP